MVFYQCPRCHYETDRKCNMRTHCIRKRKCKSIYSNIKLNKSKIDDLIITKEDENSFNIIQLKEELEQSRRELDEKNKQISEQSKQISELITKVGNNNNNTINIHVNDFKNTNYMIALDDLKESIKQSLLKNDGMNMNIECENLIELVHCNVKYPENHNILVTDKTRNEARVKDGNCFKLMPKDDVIEEATERIVQLLKENRLFGRYIRFHEKKDEDIRREDKKAVEIMLYNNRNLVMDTAKENLVKF